MSEVVPAIGKHLKDIRAKRGLSLDETARLTGVSKGMLGQIERGESNPTVATLWKIATGLKVSFSSFIERHEEELEIVSQKDINPILEDNSRMKLYPIFPFDARKGFGIFTIELEANCNHISTPHEEGVEEYIIVTEGQLELLIEGKSFFLSKGNSIKFKGNFQHSYRNSRVEKAVFQNVIIYDR